MDLKKILTDAGVTSELVGTIADTIKAEIPKEFVSKAQYSKKVNLIDELNVTIADLEAKGGKDDYKTKYDELNIQFDSYKNGIELEKTNNQKKSLVLDSLKKEGFNEKILNLLVKEFDLEKMEIEEDKIKGWEDTIKPLKESYKDFIQVEETQGKPPATPNNAGGKAGNEPTNLREALRQQYNV